MNVIPLDAKLVKGSHGVPPSNDKDGPLAILPSKISVKDKIPMTDIFHIINQFFMD
jgi:hypothetical protein